MLEIPSFVRYDEITVRFVFLMDITGILGFGLISLLLNLISNKCSHWKLVSLAKLLLYYGRLASLDSGESL